MLADPFELMIPCSLLPSSTFAASVQGLLRQSLGSVPFPRKRRREGFSADPGFVSRIVDVDVDLDVNVNVNLVDSGVDAS